MRPMSEAAYAALAVLVAVWPTESTKAALPEGAGDRAFGEGRAAEIDNNTARHVAEPIRDAMMASGANLTDVREAFGAWVGSNTQAGRAPTGWDELICEQFRWLIC